MSRHPVPQPSLSRPVPAVIALVPRDNKVILVKRANPPDTGLWGFPGGRLEAGETLFDGTIRELQEETGVTAKPIRVLDALDVLDRDPAGELQFHYVMVAVLCQWQSGTPRAADDALDSGRFDIAQLRAGGLSLSADVLRLADTAIAAGLAA